MQSLQSFKIEDLWVYFPFVPYGPQEEYMKRVVVSLQSGKNALLESPTGTGKTLCLLCGSLAWLDLQRKLEEIPELRCDDLCDESMMDETGWECHHDEVRHKIYFCSRTHSQIEQAIQELQNSAYGHVRACFMGSRQQLCINPVALQTGSNLDAKCRALRAKTNCDAAGPDIEDLPNKCGSCLRDHPCPYYENFQTMKSKGEDYIFTEGGALDRTGLINKCKKYKVCPFYVSRHLQKRADIVFIPYTYLFNPHILKGLNLNLKNSVVIVDEGHNLEKVCEENASFSVKVSEFLNAKTELNNALSLKKRMPIDEFPPDISEKDILELDEISGKLANSFEGEIKPGDNGYTGADCITYFKEAGLTHANHHRILYNLHEIIQVCGQNDMKTEGMKKLDEVCNCVFYLDQETRPGQDETDTVQLTLKESFVLYKEKEPTGPGAEEKRRSFEARIFFWCFDAGVIMRSLYREGVRSFIITSGTLAPLEPLKKSLSIPFEVELVNDHVIDSSQVLGMCIPKSQTIRGKEQDLDFKFRYRQKWGDNLYEALGHTVLKIASVSPKGLLIFFPSSTVRDECLGRWSEVQVQDDRNQVTTLLNAINTLKPIFIEPAKANELSKLQKEYCEKINEEGSTGACLIGVMSGKVSEGIDFKDDLGRVVIMIGLPFPPIEDPWIVQKRKHLERTGGEKRAEAWTLASAIRPVNQALGRIIRHQRDYGAVIMADLRYKADTRVILGLPKWLKKCKTLFNRPDLYASLSLENVPFKDLQTRLRRFFSTIPGKMQELNSVNEKRQLESLQRHSEERKKEEIGEIDYSILIKKRDLERQRERDLNLEINALKRKIEERRNLVCDLENKLVMRETSEAVRAYEICRAGYDSECDSTVDAEWEGVKG